MAFEIPMDLIRQVQIAVRIDAGLSTYDYHDPSLLPLPPLDASIAGLDPSTPADLRCQNCKGKLLRGIESLLCIYCGEKQENKDLSPGPISFNTTFAYQWLLQSLDLDQSETIGPSAEVFKLKRGQSTPKIEISLHDLLNLPIIRPNESENPEVNVTSKTLEHSSSSLNLTGDLNNIFSGSKRFIAYGASEEPVIASQIESNESKASVSEAKRILVCLQVFPLPAQLSGLLMITVMTHYLDVWQTFNLPISTRVRNHPTLLLVQLLIFLLTWIQILDKKKIKKLES